jgi:hypothetical protein
MGVPSAMVDEAGNRIPGMVPDEEIKNHPDRHSRAVMKQFYRTPEFCAACHKANLPNGLNDYKFIRAFTTYDEWQNSKVLHSAIRSRSTPPDSPPARTVICSARRN